MLRNLMMDESERRVNIARKGAKLLRRLQNQEKRNGLIKKLSVNYLE
jgi:hypothetical protein